MRRTLAVLTLGAVVVGGALAAGASDSLKVSGSTTVYANVFVPHQSKIESSSGIKLSVVSNGSGRGLADLVSGQSDVAMISSPLAEVAKKSNIDPAPLKEHKVGNSRLIFIVHPSNPVKSLTLDQVRDIFAGKITDWKDVGGTPGPILFVTEDSKGGLRTTFEDKVMKSAAVSPSARTVPNGTQIPTIVRQAAGSIGTSNPRHDLNGVKVVETEKVEQTLYLVTKGAPSPLAAKLIQAAAAAGN
jgi:phosphate transport system substrate-binding protein